MTPPDPELSPLPQTDTFVIKGPNVGELDRIRIRSSGSGLGAAWHLAQVSAGVSHEPSSPSLDDPSRAGMMQSILSPPSAYIYVLSPSLS